MRLKYALPVLALVLTLGGQAVAQTSLDEPLDDRSVKRLDRLEKAVKEIKAIVFQGRETGQPVVIQPADTDSRLSALTDQLNDIQQALTRVNGGQDTLNHALDQGQRDVAALRAENAALKARLDALEQKVAQLTAPPPATSPAPTEGVLGGPPAVDDAANAFAAAKRMLFDGDYAGAEAAFQDYVTKWPGGPRGLEAQYYLARTLLARRAFKEAADADVVAIKDWPQTPWAPEAVADLARALINLRDNAGACAVMQQLGAHYPKAAPEVKARVATYRNQAKCS